MMAQKAQQNAVAASFEAAFGAAPALTVFAPGRVNLLGEHTDYNGGYVLPMALRDLGVAVALDGAGAPGEIALRSLTLDDRATRQIGETRAGHWSDYILGAVQAVARERLQGQGLRIALSTSLPLGAGLSSSAALEVAVLRAVTGFFGIKKEATEIARIAQAVENDFVGMPCGIMDQFAASVGAPGTALFLDTRSLDHAAAPSLPGHSFLVVDSGISHKLTDSGYATRVAECQAAAAALGVAYLSQLEADDLARIDGLAAPLNRRARHIVIDNGLAQAGFAALQAGDAAAFGRLMGESHATERDNYEITVPETDALVAAAEAAGALGARQTGGGWGGAIVALVRDDRVDALGAALTGDFPKARVLAVT